MTIQTITTIELSNVCQLKCRYCIQSKLIKHPSRKPGIMTDEIFDRSLFWLDILCRRNTQAECNLNGNGESSLDPQLPERIREVKDIMGDRKVGLSTNGIGWTYELAVRVKDAGIDYMDLSPHDPYEARKAALIFHKAGIQGQLNPGTILTPHNWAGQLDKEHQIEMNYTLPCHPLMEGRGYISTEGALSPCCYDYQLIGVFGGVFDKDLLTRDIRAFSLCDTCHQVRE
jgi:hypothetical protein